MVDFFLMELGSGWNKLRCWGGIPCEVLKICKTEFRSFSGCIVSMELNLYRFHKQECGLFSWAFCISFGPSHTR